ncbi:MAG: response regulator [Lachnospiraceae bacterium]|nr:response regulator [Lachnospiraceae bacterium]
MRTKALIVDDVEMNRALLCEIMKDNFDTLEAADGEEALSVLDRLQQEIAVVLLDIIMPKMDGFEVLEKMKALGYLDKIPVLFITGDTSEEAELRGFELGISDLIRKPFKPTQAKKRVNNIVERFTYKNFLEDKVDEQTHALQEQNQILIEQKRRLEEGNVKIIDVLGTVVEYRNLESGEHIKRVKGFTEILAKYVMQNYPEYGLTEEKVAVIASASALHDIGKIAIPDNILLKPGKLTEEEFEYMKTHTTRGYEILSNIEGIWDDEYRKVGCEICRYHHERYNGKGYPDHLIGEEIPISAQIVSVADVYDALVSKRVYKSAFEKEQAFQMILDGKCGVFSPKLMECFKSAKEEFEGFATSISVPHIL